jgi:diaminohydroxyphosphoribosylaminopyrimidine deaminase/5-amino-6-(5-phosphoribosylamino)uracil reductase
MPVFSDADRKFMSRALALAEATVGLASPNPQVGCVIVRDGVVLGEGAHRYDEYDHAEIVALKAAHGKVVGATAYVTLEPCSHHGRTGPCADALVAARIARCVVATVDPNPAVSGRGIAQLRAAGTSVEIGLMEAEARRLNDAFALSITKGRPYVTLKAALSVDGMLAPPPADREATEPFWLTGEQARAEVQRLRHAADAILVGIGTVLADDPLLTDRTGLPRRRPLMRIVLDSRLRMPVSGKLVQSCAENRRKGGGEDLWIFCGQEVDAGRVSGFKELGARVTSLPFGASGLDLEALLRHLHEERLISVLAEAGSALNGALLRDDLVDRVALFYAETELGPEAVPFAQGGPSPFALEERLLEVEKRSFGPDVCVSGRLHNSWPKSTEVG